MPITQPRMINLINACLDYQQALRHAIRLTTEAHQRACQTHRQSPEDALSDLATIISTNLLADPATSAATIAVEYTHFRSRSRHNLREARRQSTKRNSKPSPHQLPNYPVYQLTNYPSQTQTPFLPNPQPLDHQPPLPDDDFTELTAEDFDDLS